MQKEDNTLKAPHPIDWNATAAWIALIISLVGSIVSPIINTIMTTRHQTKLRELDIKQRATEQYNDRRFCAINTFISKVGKFLSYRDEDPLKELGESYHCIYQYVPESYWSKLDDFYDLICNHDWDEARKVYPDIIHTLASLLKEPPQ